MDGVGGISLRATAGRFRFPVAEPGTFIYHTHEPPGGCSIPVFTARSSSNRQLRDRSNRRTCTRFSRDDLVVADPERHREPFFMLNGKGIPRRARSTCEKESAFEFAGSTSPPKSSTPCTRMDILSKSSHATPSRSTTRTSKTRSSSRPGSASTSSSTQTLAPYCYVLDHIEDASGMTHHRDSLPRHAEYAGRDVPCHDARLGSGPEGLSF